jgi:ATP synthase protein I
MPSIDRLVLRVSIPVTVAVGIVAAIIGALVASDPGKALLGAAIGTLIVVAFFTVGQVAVGAVLRNAPQMAMSVALMVYLLKIGVLFIFIILFQGTTAFDTKVFALTIVACTLAWTIAEVWIFARTKVLYVDPQQPRPPL